MLKVGTKAPLFEAPLDDGSTFRLADMRGDKNVVLYFYPKDFTAGCTKQACDFRDGHDSILRLRRRYRRHQPRLGGVAPGLQGTLQPHLPDCVGHRRLDSRPLRGEAKRLGFVRPRITYVIDKAGIIRAAFRHDIAIGRHLRDTIAALQSIQATSRT